MAGLGGPDLPEAAGRLASDLGDPASYAYFLAAASAVCAREHPAEVLVDPWRLGSSPQAHRPGAVFATAWKRRTGLPGCTP